MIILLFRHGHKAFSVDNDPALSPKGFDQAQHLTQLIAAGKIPLATHAWVSEKKRTFQTLEKAIDQHSLITFKKSELNFREANEDAVQFKYRIQKFLRELGLRAKENEIHYVCTHYDWIEEALTLMESDKDLTTFEFANWSPGQYMVFDLIDHDNYRFMNKGSL